MNNTQKTYDFDGQWADEYEEIIEQVMPGYSVHFELIASHFAAELEDSSQILVVGAGGGKEIMTLHSKNPNWQLTGVDPSSKMIDIAARKVALHGLQNVRLLHGFVSNLPENATYDGVTSSLVMHFLPDDGSKERYLSEISKRMKPGALFTLTDISGDRDSASFTRSLSAWKQFMQSRGVSESKADTILQGVLQEEHPIPERRVVDLLEANGFEHIDRFYTGMIYAGWIAQKCIL